MARPLRLEFAGALYHLTARGNARQKIFLDEEDRHRFLEFLGKEVEQQGWLLYAYCLMDNRSALEWILDQYKESKPKDPTIREKFDTYRFADYKDQVIDLLMRVTTVSIRTVAIVESMNKAAR